MTKKYRELVALQVVFQKEAETYHLIHYYRLVTPETKSSPVSVNGYSMVVMGTAESITDSVRNAYAPAVVTEWVQAAQDTNSALFQLQPSATPEDLRLDGAWDKAL